MHHSLLPKIKKPAFTKKFEGLSEVFKGAPLGNKNAAGPHIMSGGKGSDDGGADGQISKRLSSLGFDSKNLINADSGVTEKVVPESEVKSTLSKVHSHLSEMGFDQVEDHGGGYQTYSNKDGDTFTVDVGASDEDHTGEPIKSGHVAIMIGRQMS